MKTKKFCMFVVSILMMFLGIFFLTNFGGTFSNTLAQTSTLVSTNSTTSSPFSLDFTTQARSGTCIGREKTVTDTLNENTQITYICYDWRDLQGLTFTFSSTSNFDENDQNNYTGIELWVTYMCVEFDENSDEVQTMSTDTVLRIYEETIIENNFSSSSFYYSIDSTTDDESSTYHGYGFGLYKFELKYKQVINNSQNTVETFTAEEIYIAVVPDDVEEILMTINTTTLSPLYSISSSNDLLSQYYFYFNTGIFDYVNPAHLKWSAYGVSSDGVYYVLTEDMKEDLQYQGYEVLFDGIQSQTGNTFTFSSNGIEGVWTIVFTVVDDEGNELFTCSVPDISTVKTEPVDYTWLILLIVFAVLLVIAVIILIIFIVRKKDDKIW